MTKHLLIAAVSIANHLGREPRPKPVPINNTNLVAGFKAQGGRILHVPAQVKGSRGVTFAFRFLKGRIEFATAVQHRNDDFTRKIGTKTAIEHFNEGKAVFLPVSAKTVPEVITILQGIASYSQY